VAYALLYVGLRVCLGFGVPNLFSVFLSKDLQPHILQHRICRLPAAATPSWSKLTRDVLPLPRHMGRSLILDVYWTSWLAACCLNSPAAMIHKGCLLGAAQVIRCRQLGINAIVVLEQFQELEVLLEAVALLGLPEAPSIGVRARLHTRHRQSSSPFLRA
jgi:hypothetical protein